MSKWYVAIIYYTVVIAFAFYIISALFLTVDNIFSVKTIKEFGFNQYLSNIVHIHDDSWIGEIRDHGTLYAYDHKMNPTDSIMVAPGLRYENWGYKKFNDSTMLVCMKIYHTMDSTQNLYLRVPEKWSWFNMHFSPKSEYIHHDVVRRLKKEMIEEYYNDPRVKEMVVTAEGRKEIKKYKADKAYKKMKAERSFNLYQKLLVPLVEAVFVPSKRRKDFILKEDYKQLKEIKKEYLDEELMIEKYLVLNK
jgi:hypothetical protein